MMLSLINNSNEFKDTLKNYTDYTCIGVIELINGEIPNVKDFNLFTIERNCAKIIILNSNNEEIFSLCREHKDYKRVFVNVLGHEYSFMKYDGDKELYHFTDECVCNPNFSDENFYRDTKNLRKLIDESNGIIFNSYSEYNAALSVIYVDDLIEDCDKIFHKITI